MAKKQVTVYIEEELLDTAIRLAGKERRSLSNYLQLKLAAAITEDLLLDWKAGKTTLVNGVEKEVP